MTLLELLVSIRRYY